MTDLIAPGVFDLPLGWFAVHNINPGQDHCVVHHALTVIKHFGLGHVEVHVEEFVVLVGVEGHDSELGFGVLNDIGTEPNAFTGL